MCRSYAEVLVPRDSTRRHGLVVEVVESGRAFEAAGALIDRIARSSQLALRLSKAVIDADGAHPLLDDIAQAVLFESPDKRERMTQFLEKRTG